MLPKAIIGILILALIGTVTGLVTIYLNLQEHRSSLTLATTQLEATRETLDNYQELNHSLSTANEELTAKIQDQAQRNNRLKAINSDLIAESRRIYQENQRVEERNTALDQEIREVTAKNNSLNRGNRNLTARNSEVAAANEFLNQELEITDQKARALQEQSNQQARSIQTLEQEKTNLTAEVQELEGQNRSLDQQNDYQAVTIQTLEQEKTKLTADVTELQGRNRQLSQQNDTLRNKSGSINQLNARIDSLRAEIRRLEDQRKPLLLQTGRRNFTCTGSMEPKITCLDSATYLTNFLPQDIVVGTVISFDPPATCKVQSDRGVSHRVAKVKVERGNYYYWPKGDNNEAADGCWVSEKRVEGYIIELHKNTHTENAQLRNSVNSAGADAERAWDAYRAKRTSYGCPNPNQTCTVSSRGQLNVLNRLRSAYIAASIYHICWVETAGNAWYSGFGPPVYIPCTK